MMRKYFLLIIFPVVMLTSCSQLQEKDLTLEEWLEDLPPDIEVVPSKPEPLKAITIKAVGDIQMGRAWPEDQQRLPDNPDVFFEQLSNQLSSADLTFGNLETVVSNHGESKKCKRSKKCFAFRVPTSFVAAIEKAGFDLLSNNNNHANDFGEEGMLATQDAFLETEIQLASRLNPFVITTVNGVDVGLVAFATGGYDFLVQDVEASAKFVEMLDEVVDVLIVSFHAGAEGRNAYRVPRTNEEYYGEDRGDVYAFSHAVVDAGADLVLGHGPHVLRGLEIYNDRLIAYSLGNFTAWKTFKLDGKLGESMILDISLLDSGTLCSFQVLPVVVDWPGIPRLVGNKEIVRSLKNYNLDDFGEALMNDEGFYQSNNELCNKYTTQENLPNVVNDDRQ